MIPRTLQLYRILNQLHAGTVVRHSAYGLVEIVDMDCTCPVEALPLQMRKLDGTSVPDGWLTDVTGVLVDSDKLR